MINLKNSKPKWLELAEAEIGQHEIAGTEDNPAIMAFYKDSGFPEIQHDEVAWCAAFTGAMLERAGIASAKSLAARSYLTWGKPLKQPKTGCICVFSRGNPRGWQGHVGFYLGEEDGKINLLGGNQSDSVSITQMQKSRLLGYRWPVTSTNSRTTKGVGVATVGTALLTLAPAAKEITSIGTEFKGLSGISTTFTVIGAVFCIVALIAIIHARVTDAKEKGR